MTPPEYETKIAEIKASLKKLTPPIKGKKETAEERDYQASKAELEAMISLIKKYSTLYESIHVGDGIASTTKAGVIVDKQLNVGMMPQFWVQWGTVEIPYPEYPSISGEWKFETFPACTLNEKPNEQEVF